MIGSTPPALDRRRYGMPYGFLLVGVPAYVGAVVFSIWQIISDQSAAVAAAALTAIAAFTIVLAWLEVQPPDPETERRRLILVSVLAVLALCLTPLGGPSVMYVMTLAGVAGQSLASRVAIGFIGGAAGAVLAVGIVHNFTLRENFQDVVVALVVGLFTYGAKRLADTNDELVAAREELANLAVVNERLRIARDLHDLLGHSLTVIRAKSELASRVGVTDPERAAREMAEVEEVARQALVDVREAVTSYRRPTLAGERANARMALAAAGIVAEFSEDAIALSPEADETLAWVLREAVTNVVRHSGATRCHVKTMLDGDDVRLEVLDEGSGSATESVNGSGLTGLRERVTAAGGTLEVGQLAGGGFGVVARMPVAT